MPALTFALALSISTLKIPVALQLRRVGVAGVFPALRHEVVGDELHGVEAFLLVGDNVRVPEDDGAAVVAGMVVWGERQDYTVELRGADADGYAAIARGCPVSVGGFGETEDAR